MIFKFLVVTDTRMHIVFYLKRVEHQSVVQSDPINDIPLLNHVHYHFLLFESKVLIHFLPLIDELCRLDLLDRQLVEEGHLEHAQDDLEGGRVVNSEKVGERGE